MYHIGMSSNMNRKIRIALKKNLDKYHQIREKALLFAVFHKYIRQNIRVADILSTDLTEILIPLAKVRDWPGNPIFQASGWSKNMLLRYALAMHYGRGKVVLDSCSGIGWGSFLLDSVARKVVAVELDESSQNIAKKLWPGQHIEHLRATVLDLPFPEKTFDLVTAMESIEHFSPADITRYLSEITRVLKPGGMLIGSSIFPEDRSDAVAICSRNPHHLHIATRQEMIDRLDGNGFEKTRIFKNRLFFTARKKKAQP